METSKPNQTSTPRDFDLKQKSDTIYAKSLSNHTVGKYVDPSRIDKSAEALSVTSNLPVLTYPFGKPAFNDFSAARCGTLNLEKTT
ncbi:hypothetical protein TIFTF001_026154 [Ficus carica]|uniref:Uncharacterized protein n=1 Tax=Ficus carica TaxID=3494 RepID=A0AA88AL29_FICCA|nr:hypothetical protein TIFTF001_026154 [Ficus carica]